jgi:hypothetical protein
METLVGGLFKLFLIDYNNIINKGISINGVRENFVYDTNKIINVDFVYGTASCNQKSKNDDSFEIETNAFVIGESPQHTAELLKLRHKKFAVLFVTNDGKTRIAGAEQPLKLDYSIGYGPALGSEKGYQLTISGDTLYPIEFKEESTSTWYDFLNIWESAYNADIDQYIWFTTATDVSQTLTVSKSFGAVRNYRLLDAFGSFFPITSDEWHRIPMSQRLNRITAFKNYVNEIERIDIDSVQRNSVFRPSTIIPGELAETWLFATGVWNDAGIWNDKYYWTSQD